MLQFFFDASRALQGGFLRFPDFLQIGIFLLGIVNIFLQGFQTFARGFVRLLFQSFTFDLQLDQTALKPVHLLRFGVDFHADAATGLVNQVYRFVRQVAVGDVTMRQHGCRNDGRVSDGHAMVDLVLFLKPTQDGDGVFHIGFVHHDLLETAFQSRVFLQVLPVFVQGRRTHAMQLASRQRGF